MPEEGYHKSTQMDLQNTLNKIRRLRIEGWKDEDIQKHMEINDRLYRNYKERLRDECITAAMSRRPEDFIEEIEYTKEGLDDSIKTLIEEMRNPKSPAIARVQAARGAAEIRLYKIRVAYEGAAYINNLKNSMMAIPKPFEPVAMKLKKDIEKEEDEPERSEGES
jgi:hypothetical protein